MNHIGPLLRSIVHWLVQAQGMIAGYSILVMTVMVTADVIARVLFNAPSKFAVEFTAYLMVISVSFGIGYTFKEEAHIAVDLLALKLPRYARKWLQATATVLSLVFIAILFWLTWQQLMVSLRLHTLSGTPMDVPVWPVQLFIPLGLFLTGLLLLFNLFDSLHSLSQREGTVANNEKRVKTL
jgi:TRAP-type C4-dicarboxylate transport system permease small subunit